MSVEKRHWAIGFEHSYSWLEWKAKSFWKYNKIAAQHGSEVKVVGVVYFVGDQG